MHGKDPQTDSSVTSDGKSLQPVYSLSPQLLCTGVDLNKLVFCVSMERLFFMWIEPEHSQGSTKRTKGSDRRMGPNSPPLSLPHT